MSVPKKALKRWHFTTTKVADAERIQLISDLQRHASKWVFQLERAPTTGTLHFQGKAHFHIASKVPWTDFSFPSVDHWSPEVTANDSKGWTYVMKADTRVAGPWSDVSEVWTPPDWVIPTLRSWQEEAILRLHSQNKRQVLIVCDKTGSAGKTSFIRHLKATFKCLWVPATLRTAQDVVRCVACLMMRQDRTRHHTICIDVPRAMTVRSKMGWEELFTAIESIKDGAACEDRYTFQQVFFEWPRIVVMVNDQPPADLLSADRWQYIHPSPSAGTTLTTSTTSGSSSSIASSGHGPLLPTAPSLTTSSLGETIQSEPRSEDSEEEYSEDGGLVDYDDMMDLYEVTPSPPGRSRTSMRPTSSTSTTPSTSSARIGPTTTLTSTAPRSSSPPTRRRRVRRASPSRSPTPDLAQVSPLTTLVTHPLDADPTSAGMTEALSPSSLDLLAPTHRGRRSPGLPPCESRPSSPTIGRSASPAPLRTHSVPRLPRKRLPPVWSSEEEDEAPPQRVPRVFPLGAQASVPRLPPDSSRLAATLRLSAASAQAPRIPCSPPPATRPLETSSSPSRAGVQDFLTRTLSLPPFPSTTSTRHLTEEEQYWKELDNSTAYQETMRRLQARLPVGLKPHRPAPHHPPETRTSSTTQTRPSGTASSETTSPATSLADQGPDAEDEVVATLLEDADEWMLEDDGEW